jgi:hypothetical protein
MNKKKSCGGDDEREEERSPFLYQGARLSVTDAKGIGAK